MDERPAFAVGHIRLEVLDVSAEMAFYTEYGMREIVNREDFGILELRGGTHLILTPTEQSSLDGELAPFDLMVDDIDSIHQEFVTAGLRATEIERGRIHSSFDVQAPSGYQVHITSSHVAGAV